MLQISHPLAIIIIAVALAAFSAFYTVTNLQFQTSQKDLISPKERLFQLAQQVSQFEQLDSFVVVLESRDPRRSLQFLHALADRLKNDKQNYKEIFYRVDPGQFRRWALLYLNQKELGALGDQLREHRQFIDEIAKNPALVTFFEQINREMTHNMVGQLFTGFLETPAAGAKAEPLNLDFLIRVLQGMNGYLEGDRSFASPWNMLFTGSFGAESEEGYFWTKDKKYLLLFATPTSKDDFAGTWHALSALRTTIAEVQVANPGVRVGVTGPEALNADQMSTAMGDMGVATLASLCGLALLLMFFWRGLRRPALEVVILLVALCWTFGLTTLFIGHLNILSITFAPLLLGLGIDYGAHWFARYREEEKHGLAKKEALQSVMEQLGPGILLAGASASLSFFPLVLTGFKGLMELGIICSMGLAIMTLSTLILLPALVLLFDKPVLNYKPSLPPLRPFFVFTRWRVLGILIISLVGFGFSIWGAEKVRFDLNMLNLQSPKVESVIWEKKLLQGSELSSIYGEVVASSLQEVREKTKALETLPTVSRVESIDTILPHDQEQKIEILRRMKPLLAGIDKPPLRDNPVHLEALENVLGRIRFKMLADSAKEWGVNRPLEQQMGQVRELIDRLQKRFRSPGASKVRAGLRAYEKDMMKDLRDKLEILRENANPRPMNIEDLPPELRKRFVSANGVFLIRIFPKENVWQPELLGRFVHDLRSVDPNAVGDPVTLYVFTRAFRDGCIKAALYAVAFIFIFLFLTFRDLRSTALALVPLVAGTAWTLGLMEVFKVDLNLANSLFMPLVVGAAVEYAIIIVHRWRQREKNKEGIVLPYSTAMGVILAGLTTTIGFCSLCISAHQGIFSLGVLTTFGSLTILAAAVFFLPALLQFFSSRSKK